MLSYDLQEPHLTVVFHWREQAHWYEHEEGVRTKVCPVEELYVHDRDDVGDRQANVVRLAKLLWQRLQLPVLRAVSDGCGDSSEQAATSDQVELNVNGDVCDGKVRRDEHDPVERLQYRIYLEPPILVDSEHVLRIEVPGHDRSSFQKDQELQVLPHLSIL